MAKPIDVRTRINLPSGNSDVSIVLVETNAVQISHGIQLFLSGNLIRDILPWGVNPVSVPHSLGHAQALKGLMTDCFGRVFHTDAQQVVFRCDFVMNGQVVARSDDATIDLTAAAPSREFHIRCLFE
jgi:hypothetical protein